MSLACDYVMFYGETLYIRLDEEEESKGRMSWHCRNHVLNSERLQNALTAKSRGIKSQ